VIGLLTLVSLLALLFSVLLAGGENAAGLAGGTTLTPEVWLTQTFCTPVLWLSFFRKMDAPET